MEGLVLSHMHTQQLYYGRMIIVHGLQCVCGLVFYQGFTCIVKLEQRSEITAS